MDGLMPFVAMTDGVKVHWIGVRLTNYVNHERVDKALDKKHLQDMLTDFYRKTNRKKDGNLYEESLDANAFLCHRSFFGEEKKNQTEIFILMRS
jgi:hypothetical protein